MCKSQHKCAYPCTLQAMTDTHIQFAQNYHPLLLKDSNMLVPPEFLIWQQIQLN